LICSAYLARGNRLVEISGRREFERLLKPRGK
jgi:hypothetical protein